MEINGSRRPCSPPSHFLPREVRLHPAKPLQEFLASLLLIQWLVCVLIIAPLTWLTSASWMFSNLSFYNSLFPIFFLLCLLFLQSWSSSLFLYWGSSSRVSPCCRCFHVTLCSSSAVSFIHPGGRNGPWIQACTYLHSGTIVTVVSEMVMLSVSHRAFAYTGSSVWNSLPR